MAVGNHPQNPHGFESAGQFRNDYSLLVCQRTELQPIARAFIRNMNRVRGLGLLPINLVTTAIINESARIEALINKGIPIHDPRITYGDPKFDTELFDKVDTERKRIVSEWLKKASDERIFLMGSYGLNIIVDSNREKAGEAVQATMAAMLIGLWTAFESLVQDTWISAVNARPIPLAQRVLEPNAHLGTGDQQKTVPWRIISRMGFNLQGLMGTVLLRRRVVDFQQLKTIRLAYKTAFAGAFEPIFETHATELSRLEAVRNLFVHKGGLIDRKFTQRMGDEPGMREKEGCSLTVLGEYVAHKAETIAQCSTQLIQAVDKWLTENPAKTEDESQPSDADDDS